MSSRIRTYEAKPSSPSSVEQFAYIEINISKEETLLSLSMKFNTTVADLKRLNSLQNDRDVYALSSVKIPIKLHSILAQQYESQLKYGDANQTRLSSNMRLDSSVERELADKRILNEKSEDDEDDDQNDPNIISSNNINPYSNINNNTSNSTVGFKYNINEKSYEMETQFSNKVIQFEEEDDHELDNYTDKTALLINREESNNQIMSSIGKKNNDKQVKEAKRFFKKIDNQFDVLKHQNEDIINHVIKNTDQLIPIPHDTDGFSIETNKKSETNYMLNNFFNVRDILIIACFIVVLVPLAIFIYSFFYNNEHAR
jgi:hypothetical protein